jgi:hypothetical protein
VARRPGGSTSTRRAGAASGAPPRALPSAGPRDGRGGEGRTTGGTHQTAPARAGLAALLAGALLSAGCVERALLVQSDPPGAQLFVNGVARGATPATIRYVHEGRFELRAEKAGYESVATEVTTRTRLDAVPGPDFVAENLWPGRIRRTTPVTLRLPPLKRESYTKEEVAGLVDRAKAFRAKARAAVSEPGTPSPTPRAQRPGSPVDPFPAPPPTVR